MRIDIKFNPKEKVWFMEDNKAKQDTIGRIEVIVRNSEKSEICYVFERPIKNFHCYTGVFATKQELLNSL